MIVCEECPAQIQGDRENLKKLFAIIFSRKIFMKVLFREIDLPVAEGNAEVFVIQGLMFDMLKRILKFSYKLQIDVEV